jgi:hypothetical protein
MIPAPATPAAYTGPGFHFRYPGDWTIEEERGDHELTVTVRPHEDEEGTAFWSLTILLERPQVQPALRAVLRAFEESYEELDAYPAEEQIAGRKAVGRDLEFVCLELLNTARLRVFRTRDFTAVVLWQATDEELANYQSGFRTVTGSLQCGWQAAGEEE